MLEIRVAPLPRDNGFNVSISGQFGCRGTYPNASDVRIGLANIGAFHID